MPEPPHTLESGGRVYHARAKIDGAMLKAWARWLFMRYREIEELTKEDVSEEEYRSRLNDLDDLHFAGEFHMLSERGKAAMKTRDGAVKLTAMIFDLDEADALALMATKGVEVGALVHTVLRASFPMATPAPGGGGTPDPNAQGPGPSETAPAADRKEDGPAYRPTRRRGRTPATPSSSTASGSPSATSTP